ncbi:hypothetical protein SRB17_79160 [Streptomyces sp. RB17]|nr:hypothetical protein [Streptomyces sp. RB17]
MTSQSVPAGRPVAKLRVWVAASLLKGPAVVTTAGQQGLNSGGATCRNDQAQAPPGNPFLRITSAYQWALSLGMRRWVG